MDWKSFEVTTRIVLPIDRLSFNPGWISHENVPHRFPKVGNVSRGRWKACSTNAKALSLIQYFVGLDILGRWHTSSRMVPSSSPNLGPRCLGDGRYALHCSNHLSMSPSWSSSTLMVSAFALSGTRVLAFYVLAEELTYSNHYIYRPE